MRGRHKHLRNGYHSPAPGVYDFSGIRNVERALQIAEEEGMYVIARTGPYVNAELTGGGYPGWMFRSRPVRGVEARHPHQRGPGR